jgi:hypothetical protein
MGGELHDGVVAFRPLSSGREAVVLGRVDVGEISPVAHPTSAIAMCFRIQLPGLTSHAWTPARDVTEARRLALEQINDWLNAADLRPNGAA